MLKPAHFSALLRCRNVYATYKTRNFRVSVIGAAGGIGQPLSLLLKRDPLITALSLYDIANMPGVTADLSHIDTNSVVEGFSGKDLNKALQCADIVVIPGGMPRKPGMQRDDLFKKNADVIKVTAAEIAKTCPKALIAIITNPVNTVVPLAAEILKKANVFDPNRLFGVTTLDVVRSRTFIADICQIDPHKVTIPVIGGHAGITILPLLSQCHPTFNEDDEVKDKLIKRIQEAGTEVVKAKAGTGSATVSMAHAAALFVNSLLKGLKADGGATECAYVHSNVTEVSFFSTPLLLGKGGVSKNLGLPKLNKDEEERLKKLIPQLKKEIAKGIEYANKS